MKNHAARQANDRRLHEKRQRRVRQGKIAVGNLAEGDALGGIQNVAEIEENGDVRVLPKHHAGGGRKERRRGDPVARRPAQRNRFRLRRLRFCCFRLSRYHPR